eukprot:SAG31_NODE_2729_length_5177_cov_2.657542_2_plen_210_part_00
MQLELGRVAALPKSQQKAAAEATALPLFANLSRAYEQHMSTLLSYTNSQGELGMITEHEGGFAAGGGNFHLASQLESFGVKIPPTAMPTTEYIGNPRIFVLTERTMVDPKVETSLEITVIVLASQETLPSRISLLHRHLNGGAAGSFASVSLLRAGTDRGVYTGRLPVAANTPEELGSGDFEYKVEAHAGGIILQYPAAGTVIVTAIPH